MTTLSLPSKSSEGTFSYAAAASGKHSPKPATTPNTAPPPAPQVNSLGASTPNGIPTDRTKSPVTESVPQSDSSGCPKPKASNVPSNTAAPDPTTALNGETTPSSSDPDPKPLTDEKISFGSEQLEGDQTETAKDTLKSMEAAEKKLLPAPPPPVNIWKLRAEEFTAKAKLQPAATPLASVAVKPVSSKVTERVTETKPTDRKRGGNKTDTGNWDSEKTREGNAHERKDGAKEGGRDRKKSTDSGRTNGHSSREDGNIRHSKPHRHVSKVNTDKDTAMTELPPPLGDATSWPTPEIAQDEGKKEKERIQREEKEKEKPAVARSSGPTKFVPAPFTPTIVHNAPLPSKGGRGGRGARGGSTGRGGSASIPATDARNERAEKADKSVGTGPVSQPSETERGRVGGRGTGYNGRGRGRRNSVGSNVPRKASSPINPSQERKEGEQNTPNKGTNVIPENAQAPAASTSAQAEVRQDTESSAPRADNDDGAFIGQGVIPPQYPERHERVHNHGFNGGSGQTYQRPDGANMHSEPAAYPQTRPERSSMGTRGGFRGRMSSFSHQHHHSSHSSTHGNAMSTQSYHNQNPQPYSAHNSSYRGYGRGPRGHAPTRGYNQPYHPAIFSHQPFPPAYPYYDYSAGTNVPALAAMTSNHGNTQIPGMDDPFAHRDYAYGKELYTPLLLQLTKQMEYYFSVDNLCKDIFLRKHMDSEGFVSLDLVAGFSLIRKLTHNMEMLRDACTASPHIGLALADDGYRVRKASGYESFLLRPEDRDPSVKNRPSTQNTGPPSDSGHSNTSSRPQMSAAAPPFQPSLEREHSPNNVTTVTESLPPVQYSQPIVNGSYLPSPSKVESNEIQRSHSHLSADAAEFSPLVNGSTPQQPTEIQSDSQLDPVDFPDERIGEVNIIYKKSFLDNTMSPEAPPAVNGEVLSDDETESCLCSPHSGRLSRHGVSWSIGTHSEESIAVKHIHEKYTALRTAALQKRLEGSPTSVKMTILYRFWNHFLMKHFNRKMYDEFKLLAMEDAHTTSGKSLDLLFGFYEAIHLSGSPPEDVSRDFVDLSQKSVESGSKIGVLRLENTLNNLHLKPTMRNVLQGLVSTTLKKTP